MPLAACSRCLAARTRAAAAEAAASAAAPAKGGLSGHYLEEMKKYQSLAGERTGGARPLMK
jgi:hypothetical protein